MRVENYCPKYYYISIILVDLTVLINTFSIANTGISQTDHKVEKKGYLIVIIHSHMIGSGSDMG